MVIAEELSSTDFFIIETTTFIEKEGMQRAYKRNQAHKKDSLKKGCQLSKILLG